MHDDASRHARARRTKPLRHDRPLRWQGEDRERIEKQLLWKAISRGEAKLALPSFRRGHHFGRDAFGKAQQALRRRPVALDDGAPARRPSQRRVNRQIKPGLS
jgi:hypothetical protein